MASTHDSTLPVTQESVSDKIILGNLGAVYGIKGWLRINSFTEQVEDIFAYTPWFIGRGGNWQPVEVSQWRRHNKGLVAKLSHIDDRDEAAAFTGMDIAVNTDVLPVLNEDEFYWRDLQGLRVINLQGYDMGLVDHVFSTPANDVLVVIANTNDAFGKHERLIPFVHPEVVHDVRREERQLIVDWPADF